MTDEQLIAGLREIVGTLQRVTHWERGVIPGLVAAPRSGSFLPTSEDLAKMLVMRRAYAYEEAVRAYIAEEIDFEQVYRCWSEPVFGAFGERL